jgi:phosphate transport system substrate-binding protein
MWMVSWVGLVASAVIPMCACAQEVGPYQPVQQVDGTIRLFGGRFGGFQVHTNKQASIFPLWEAGFRKAQPGADFANNFSTSSEGALAGLVTGVSDLGPAGDEAQLSEREMFFTAKHYDPLEIVIATGGYDAVATAWAPAIVVNKDNPLAKLTMEQLDGIFGAERNGGWDGRMWKPDYARGAEKDIRTWGQLGLQGEWANKPIHTFGYTAANAFGYFFQRAVLHGSDKWNPNYKQFVEFMQAPGDAAGKTLNAAAALEQIQNDKYALGWAAAMHAKDYPGVKTIALANISAGPYVPLSAATVEDRTYPFVRNVLFYVDRVPGMPVEPKVKEFLRYVLSADGQKELRQFGYFPLPKAVIEEQLRKLE